MHCYGLPDRKRFDPLLLFFPLKPPIFALGEDGLLSSRTFVEGAKELLSSTGQGLRLDLSDRIWK